MSQRPTHILLVDDDTDLLDLLSFVLVRRGYRVTTATDGEEALTCWAAERPDLVLLDGILPKLDGFDVCCRLKAQATTPVILLTGRHEEAEVLRGLRQGADDYLTKPFSPRQLLARMEAVLRRYRTTARQSTRELRVGPLVLDRGTHTATTTGQPVPLTAREFRLLDLLMTNAGQVVPTERLLEYSARQGREVARPVALRTHISHLRRTLGLPASGPGSIQAARGIGYLLVRGEP
jgi:DNA-binding response OmpR family regulator